jgi:hypothetical protein
MRKSTLFAMLVILACIVGAFIINENPYAPTLSKEQQFLICSENEGDAGCDSCWYKVYGYYLSEDEIYGRN